MKNIISSKNFTREFIFKLFRIADDIKNGSDARRNIYKTILITHTVLIYTIKYYIILYYTMVYYLIIYYNILYKTII